MFGGQGPARGGSTRGGRARTTSFPGEDVEGQAEITLEEAYRGTKMTVELAGGPRPKKVEVSIPAGIKDGARVRVAGQGGAGQGGGPAGDLFIRVHVLPHKVFTREGDNVRLKAEVPLATALLGGAVEIPTLSGKRVSLTIPPDTQNGSVLRLRGLGMPKLRGAGPGDLLAEVHVRLPVPLTPELKEWAAKLKELEAKK
jgi:DnaJ-class molecular chaperone